MNRLEEVPNQIMEEFSKKGIKEEDILFGAQSDLSDEGLFCDTWLMVTREKLIVMSAENMTYDKIAQKYKKFKKPEVQEWQPITYKEYNIGDITNCKAESYISTGAFTVNINDIDYPVCHFTNTHVRKFSNVSNFISKLIKKEELTDDDFKDDKVSVKCPKCGRYYENPATKFCPHCIDRKGLFVRILSYTPKYLKYVILMLAAMLAESGVSLISPILGGSVMYDQVFKEGNANYGKVGTLVLAMVLIDVLRMLIGIFNRRVGAKVSAKVVYDIKVQVFTAMQKLSMSFYSSKQTGTLMTRVNDDAMHIQYFLIDGLTFFIVNFFNLIGILVILLLYNWQLTIIAFLPVPFIIVWVKKIAPKFMRMRSRVWAKRSKLNALLNDVLTGVRVVKAFGKEKIEVNRFEHSNKELFDINLKVGMITTTVFPFYNYFISLGGLVVTAIGGWQVVSGKNITLGVLMTFTGYLGRIYGPVEFMTHIVDWWSNAMNSAHRIFEIIDTKSEVVESTDPVKVGKIKGDITLKNVSFAYEPNKPVLHNVNIEIPAGEMIGLVGHSGAGKSTITNLITRLYDVTDGEILIDGVNIKDIASDELRPVPANQLYRVQ